MHGTEQMLEQYYSMQAQCNKALLAIDKISELVNKFLNFEYATIDELRTATDLVVECQTVLRDVR